MAKFQLLSYATSDQRRAKKLLEETRRQAGLWDASLKGQIGPSQIMTSQTGGTFRVFVLIPLTGIQEFPAIWDGVLSETLDENLTLDLEERGEMAP